MSGLNLISSVAAYNKTPATGTISFQDATNGDSVFATVPLSGGNGNVRFTNVFTSGVSNGIYSATEGDFNGDGIPDLLAVNVDGTAAVLFGNGDGTFTAASSFSDGEDYPQSVAVGDFNGDGILDLAVLGPAPGEGTLSILLGRGNGKFTVRTKLFAPSTGPLVVGDFNGDGILDVAIANFYGKSISILTGKGDGALNAAVTVSIDHQPNSIAVEDSNGDGIPDLLTVNGDNTVTVLFGNGDGTFTQETTPLPSPSAAARVQVTFAVVADFNGDGVPDLALTYVYFTGPSTITVLLGNSDGTFTTKSTVNVTGFLSGMATGDFNGDGIQDLVTNGDIPAAGGYIPGGFILFGHGDGTFTIESSPSAVPGTVADFNGDGLSDVAVANYGLGAVNILLAGAATTAITTTVAVPGSGTHNVFASYPGDSDHDASTSTNVAIIAGKPVMDLVSGNGQTGIVGRHFVNPLEVVVKDAENHPLPGVTVNFSGAGLAFSSATATTDTHGDAEVVATPTAAGNLTAAASVTGIAEPVTFSLKAIAMEYPTATTLSISPGIMVTPGTVVTLTALVLPEGKPVSPGIVVFCNAAAAHCEDVNILGQAQLTGNGTATLRTRFGLGAHSIKAEFHGTYFIAASTSATQTVTVSGKYQSATTISASSGTFSSSVSTPGPIPLLGTVQYLDETNRKYEFASAPLGKKARPFRSRLAFSSRSDLTPI